MRDRERTAEPKQGPATLTTAPSAAIPLGVTEAYLSALAAAIATIRRHPPLAGYTINGAAQLGLEGEVGVIKTGLLAEFIVLPQNPFETDVEKIHAIEPSATVVAGELRSGGF